MRISDWSSDVCSSDLVGAVRNDRPDFVEQVVDRSLCANGGRFHHIAGPELDCVRAMQSDVERAPDIALRGRRKACEPLHFLQGRRAVIASVKDRKSVVSGKSVSVRVDLGGRRILKKKTNIYNDYNKNK